jgi:hypothetical protein
VTLTAPQRRRRTWISALAVFVVIAAGLTAAFGLGFTEDTPAAAANDHTVTFVNDSGEKIWVGSLVNDDGSENFAKLPILEPGQSATIVIPEHSGPGHWRGKFFARTGCAGQSGSTFRCKVGECGNAEDHCISKPGDFVTPVEENASLAEFNFDPNDAMRTTWYNVSYVNAVSLPITISPTGSAKPADGQYCAEAGCNKPLLDSCPAENIQRDEQGKVLACVNTNKKRDDPSAYSEAIGKACPRAYSWSHGDVGPNQTMFSCDVCTGFTVTFHSNGKTGGQPTTPPTRGNLKVPGPDTTTGAETTTGAGTNSVDGPVSKLVSNFEGRCIDVPNGNFADRVRLIVFDCGNAATQSFTFADDGTLRIGGKCVDVADGSVNDMAHIQLFTCNGTPAQQWVLSQAGDLVNPVADKCIDIEAWKGGNGVPLQLWTCNGFANRPVSSRRGGAAAL